jgi:hypothetical protein
MQAYKISYEAKKKLSEGEFSNLYRSRCPVYTQLEGIIQMYYKSRLNWKQIIFTNIQNVQRGSSQMLGPDNKINLRENDCINVCPIRDATEFQIFRS